MIAFPTPCTPFRICFVCDEYPPATHGGIGSLIQSLARALVNEGHQVRVVGVQSDRCPAAAYEEDQGVKVWRQRAPRWRHAWPLSRYRVLRTVKQWCRNEDIDLVEVVDFTGPAAMWPKLPVPIVARIHGSATYFAAELNRRLTRHDYLIERASLRRADYICSISGYAADRSRELFDLGDRPIEILHDFVDPSADPASTARSDNHVVFSGTLTAKKGVIELFQAWKHVIARNKDARLHLYGKDCRTDDGGSMRELLISLLEPTIRDTVWFHGHTTRTELFAALSQARVGVFPSYSETFGLGPVESMAAGCPTIYGRCGCAGEIIRDGIDGLLVDPDQPKQIADAILRLLNNNSLSLRLSQAGRRRVAEQFSLETMLHRNEEFYQQCIDEFAKRDRQRDNADDGLDSIEGVSQRRSECSPNSEQPSLV